MRAPVSHPFKRWRIQPSDATLDDEFIACCLALWDQGKDTKDISMILLEHEFVVERATRFGRERRRQGAFR